ncbi:hypothetical protein OPV22_003378 [Ensete ventricosum]|uniref:DRBM domain-containing protein n=1 Tax=Ensete ventricosum TaxID=4639 RepID=A0AAV8S0M8_ENSVE|nr:hypothetical protein OPV22_003378 [Ensete ventricosum]
MYKSRLQELCQRRHWALPQYTASRDGPDHSPLFRATVTVNGAAFHSLDDSRSSKQAQDRAAQIAFEQLSAEDPPTAPSRPLPVALDNQVSYKNQLQIYLQKKNKGLPSYISVHDGGSPIRHFKAFVKIDGQSFESTGYFHTIKEAEQSAAMAALMSLFPEGNKQDDAVYKNLLQELTQKHGFPLPKYTTTSYVKSHIPSFSSTVEIKGEFFKGDVAKTKKQAEMNAAKVAWSHLKEGISSRFTSDLLAKWEVQIASEPVISRSDTKTNLKCLKPSVDAHKMDDIISGDILVIAFVKIDGQSFESTGYFHTIKEAEQSAAMAALMSLFPEGNKQANAVYKNLLQELTQKHGFPLPKYTTTSYGKSHIPSFSSTVEIKGEFFKGDVAKTRKQAEMNAAKVAWSHLKEGISSRYTSDLLAKWQVQIASEPVISRSDTKTNLKCKPSVDAHKMDDIISDGHGEASGSTASPPCDQIINTAKEVMNTDGSFRHSASCTDEHNPEITINKKDTVSLVHKPEVVDVLKNRNTLQGAMSDDGSSALSSNSNTSNIHAKTATEPPTGRNTLLLCKRVQIYPHKSDLVLPEGANPLPCSDDSWVAVSFHL